MVIKNMFQISQNKPIEVTGECGLSLGKITLDENYAKEWNVHHMSDFVTILKNGEILKPVLYRLSGVNHNLDLKKDRFFMLLKYTEAYHTDDIMKRCGNKAPRTNKYLKSVWCIFNDKGEELYESIEYGTSPYLIKDAPIFSVNNKYYNLLTKEYLGQPSTIIKNDSFMIFDNQCEKDEKIKGILKINKIDASYEKIG